MLLEARSDFDLKLLLTTLAQGSETTGRAKTTRSEMKIAAKRMSGQPRSRAMLKNKFCEE